MSPPLGIGWHPGSHFGYGVLGLRLVIEFLRSGLRQPVLLFDSEISKLQKRFETSVSPDEDGFKL